MKLPYGFDNEDWMQPFFQIADALRQLGNGNASTNMGAIENLAKNVSDLKHLYIEVYSPETDTALSEIASALNSVAEAIREKEGK